MADNVIEFPKPDDGCELGRMPSTMDEAKARIEGVRQYYIDELTAALVEVMANQLMAGGFPILDDEYKKDFGFLIETVRSTMCTTSGLYHPFQDIAEEVMLEDEEGRLHIADEVSVTFGQDVIEVELENDDESEDAVESVLDGSS
jgi:hypothetical protein